ncbi:hypothetical protein, partial [Leucobacter sp. M11]|uniref:hypothetical protein n=1 Tax=Leucobacter sp. M11 TaxID=2993565 RepID=UPI002D802EF8
DILRNIAELPEWNPALTAIATRDAVARLEHPYPVTTRLPGRATLSYLSVDEDRISWVLRVAGSVERAEWLLAPEGAGTRVTHTMAHSGTVFSVLRRAMEQTPGLRLDRLRARAEPA